MSTLDVAIIGAGPAGLATAIECARRGRAYAVFEKGALVDSIRRFPVQMVFFTTPELLEIGDLPLVTPHEKPTRVEALKYYRRVAEHYQLRLHLYEKVDDVQREGATFSLHTTPRLGPPQVYTAKNVVVATGYYGNPNMLGIPGEDLPKVSHYYREAHCYFDMEVAVIGGANSAAEAALELYRSGVRVTLIHREKELSTHIKYWVRPDILNRIERKEIRALLDTAVEEILPEKLKLKKRAASVSRSPTTSSWRSPVIIPTTDCSSPWGFESVPKAASPSMIPTLWKRMFRAYISRAASR